MARDKNREPAAISRSEEGPEEFFCVNCQEAFDGFMSWKCDHDEFFDCCFFCADVKFSNDCRKLTHLSWEPETKWN